MVSSLVLVYASTIFIAYPQIHNHALIFLIFGCILAFGNWGTRITKENNLHNSSRINNYNVYGTGMLKKTGRKYSHDSNIGKKKNKTRGEGESP
jgi:hypothetical protein